MAIQTVFRRHELKYLLTDAQKMRILRAMQGHMVLDEYGRSGIRNLYYDTDSFRLARRSIESPSYKEKLRVRSYGRAAMDGQVFVELKKKYEGVVYKRRLALPQEQALAWLRSEIPAPQGQIASEIRYFRDFYTPVKPVVFLSYSREAFYATDGSAFRVTFDDEILCRRDGLTLDTGTGGVSLLPQGTVLMELKCPGAIPLWMTQVLSAQHIYRTPFSKYGEAYRRMIFSQRKGLEQYA